VEEEERASWKDEGEELQTEVAWKEVAVAVGIPYEAEVGVVWTSSWGWREGRFGKGGHPGWGFVLLSVSQHLFHTSLL